MNLLILVNAKIIFSYTIDNVTSSEIRGTFMKLVVISLNILVCITLFSCGEKSSFCGKNKRATANSSIPSENSDSQAVQEEAGEVHPVSLLDVCNSHSKTEINIGPGWAGEESSDEEVFLASLKGLICPSSTNRLFVLFIIDHSGSMGRHNDPSLGRLPGNDPQVDGSCGRLRAARAVINQLNQTKFNGDEIRIAMIPFASDVLHKKVVEPILLEDFESALNSETFCQYIVQNEEMDGTEDSISNPNPGGLSGEI